MSQKATSARRCGMSVLPSEADMPVTGCFAPILLQKSKIEQP